MEINNKITPDACRNMEDIRAEIDLIDRAVVGLIGKRYQYVLAAAKYKTSTATVRAPERFKAMLEKRREWAIEEGLNPDAIEKLYEDLVNHFIDEELQRWKAQNSLNPSASPHPAST